MQKTIQTYVLYYIVAALNLIIAVLELRNGETVQAVISVLLTLVFGLLGLSGTEKYKDRKIFRQAAWVILILIVASLVYTMLK
jgi:hypothetical protein